MNELDNYIGDVDDNDNPVIIADVCFEKETEGTEYVLIRKQGTGELYTISLEEYFQEHEEEESVTSDELFAFYKHKRGGSDYTY